jgi:phosphatidate cytidylyltransferase
MKRILTALVLIAAVFALLFFGQLWMITLFAAIVAGLAAVEYVQLASGEGVRVPLWWMLGSVALVFLVTYNWPSELYLPVLSFLSMLLFGVAAFTLELPRVLPTSAIGVFGLIYIAYPLTLIPLLWRQEDGLALVLFLMLCVWAGDIVALYVGRTIGRHKLAPRLSPGKTWEGAVGSVVGSLAAAAALVLVSDNLEGRGSTLLHIGEPLWQTLLLAIVLNVAAQVGDLVESAIKRGAGVKDSGTMLPGHGGVLDRIDALLLAAPVLWYVLQLKEWFGLGRF